jgi:hypothetical protein
MKRSLAFLLSLVMILALVACGSKDTGKDEAGNTRKVLTDKPGLYNLMATEYVYDNKKSSARIIYSTSSAVIHLIDGPLLVNENQ